MADKKPPLKTFRVQAGDEKKGVSFVVSAESDADANDKAKAALATIGLEGAKFSLAES